MIQRKSKSSVGGQLTLEAISMLVSQNPSSVSVANLFTVSCRKSAAIVTARVHSLGIHTVADLLEKWPNVYQKATYAIRHRVEEALKDIGYMCEHTLTIKPMTEID